MSLNLKEAITCILLLALSNLSFGQEAGINRNTISNLVQIQDKTDRNASVLHYSPNADLVKYPLFEYKAEAEKIRPIPVRSTVPNEIWDLPLRIVNDTKGRDSITLRELAGDKLLVLDFWATWCKPCLESMDKWKEIQPRYVDDVQVVGLMMDYDFKASLEIEKRSWKMPQIIGPEVYFLNTYFCGTPIIGPSAWIYQSHFVGVSETKADGESLVNRFFSGEITVIPEDVAFDAEKFKARFGN